MFREQFQGLTYLLSHPLQLKRLIIRETRYRQRQQNKRKWMEWQKYNNSTTTGHSTATAYSRPLNVVRIQTISDMVNRIGNGLSVLDVGCGNGDISDIISKMGNHVMSVDLPPMTILAHKRRVSSVVTGDAEQLAFVSNSLDIVLASEVVEHLWNPDNFFHEAHRVLKTNGYLIVETPEGKESLRYDSHRHFFTVECLEQMLDASFSVREVKRLEPTLGAPTPTIIVLLRRIHDQD